MIRQLAAGIYQFFGDLFGTLFSFLGGLFSALFEGLVNFLIWLLTPILQIIATIFYFLYKLGALLLLVIEFVFKLVFFFVYVMKGLFLTLIGLSYNGQAAVLPARYQEVVTNIQPAFEILQLNKISTLLLWGVWIFVAVACIKVVGDRR
jgi:hypothetical protein